MYPHRALSSQRLASNQARIKVLGRGALSQGLIRRWLILLGFLCFCLFFLDTFKQGLQTLVFGQSKPLDPWSTVPEPPAVPFVLEDSGGGMKGEERENQRKKKLRKAQDMVRAFKSAEQPFMPNPSFMSPSNSTIYLALNLIDAEAILPNFMHELATLVSLMGPDRFYMSVWENGSKDHTPGLIVLMERMLKILGVRYKLVVKAMSQPQNKSQGHRIDELAKARNAVLEELYTGEAAKKMGIAGFDMVLFMNDIIYCAADMLEIIEEHIVQDADMTCATEWGTRVVYDRWVARTMSGKPFYLQSDLHSYFNGGRQWDAYSPEPPYPLPLVNDPLTRAKFNAIEPFQVFSCWNGAVVMTPRAFMAANHTAYVSTKNNGIGEPVRFRTAWNKVNEVASECFLVCVDFWKRGMGRIIMVPKASVAYTLGQYAEFRQDGRREIPHPVGIEPSHSSAKFRKQKENTGGFWGRFWGNNGTPEIGEGRTKVEWTHEPPKEVVYHDWAFWADKERWGPWDEL